MIEPMKCAEFNKFMNYYKKKTHLSFYDYQNFMFATSMQISQNIKINSYDNWQKEHEVVKMDIDTPAEKKYVFIDFSLNSIRCRIQY